MLFSTGNYAAANSSAIVWTPALTADGVVVKQDRWFSDEFSAQPVPANRLITVSTASNGLTRATIQYTATEADEGKIIGIQLGGDITTPLAGADYYGMMDSVVLTSTTLIGGNLIANPDAETGPFTTGGVNHLVWGWDDSGAAVQQEFNLSYWGSLAPSPEFGNNFFYGGNGNAFSTLTDVIDLSELATKIDAGVIQFDLFGDFGGWGSQDDNATLTAEFLDADGNLIDSLILGGFLALDRGGVTGFLHDSEEGLLPAGTRAARLTLAFTRVSGGSANDGAADNLGFVLTDNTIPEPSTILALSLASILGFTRRRRASHE